ncbi:MAG: class IV adenylate cyclase [Candidatus Paceibacterota bacterium]|nr:class IV adenylate cyclase [Candidatus Paceibacterota bacterium]
MTNFEIKINIQSLDVIEKNLKRIGATYKYDMHQIDHYFGVGVFKEKIREIDNKEIQKISYHRNEISGKKESNYSIKKINKEEKEKILNEENILCVVEKIRKFWIYKNTRVHLDNVFGLGHFLELETVIKDITQEEGLVEFKDVLKILKIDIKESVACSYSDLILNNQKKYFTFVSTNKSVSF